LDDSPTLRELIPMRTTLLCFALVVLSGCATPRVPESRDVKQPTLLQRLGLGRPLGARPPDQYIPAESGPARARDSIAPGDAPPPAGLDPNG
jgi:hypothetical protein